MAAALRLALDVLFREFEHHRVWAQILEPNGASLRLFEAAGFTREGLLRETTWHEGHRVGTWMLSVLRPEWEAAPGNRR